MKKFLVERKIDGLGRLSPDSLHKMVEASNEVLNGLDTPYHWVQSFVTNDTLYCLHVAPDEEAILEHARRGGFPADRVMEVKTTIDATS